MPREARIVLPGYLYHITQRGNYRQNVFSDDQDRVVYLKNINKCCDKYGMDIFSFCLMDNHVHFIVRPETKSSLSKVFSVAHMKYSHYFNKRFNVAGHLWQGRFYSCMLEGSHVEKAVRYVEQNPVRAGMAKYPWEHHWSSSKARLGIHYEIIQLADIREYIKTDDWKGFLIGECCEEDRRVLRERTIHSSVWGTDVFIKGIESFLGRKIIKYRGRLLAKIGTDAIC